MFSSATVTEHVLSFGTTKVASGVNVTTTKKNLVKTGFTYTAPTTTDSGFKTSGFTQSADIKYTFGRGNETTYSATPAMWKLETPELNVSKGKYEINHTNMVATVSEGMFYANATAGTLPSLTQGSVSTTTLTGSVGTALTTADKTIRAVADGLDSITLPGAYTLTTAKEGEGDVTVAAAGNTVTASASVNLGGYVTDVVISDVVVS